MSKRAQLSTVAMIRVVARREIRERMRAKSFLVGTGVLVVVIIALGLISRLASSDQPDAIEVGVASERSEEVVETLEAVAATVDREVSVTFFDDIDAAQVALDDGAVDVVVDPKNNQALFDEDVNDQTLKIVQQTWSQLEVLTRLADAGLSPGDITHVLSVAPLEPITVNGDDESDALGMLTGTVGAVLLFLSLQTFGTYVLTGVVEEKSSAVIEILLVRARADQLLAGKIIGIGVVALTQFAAAVTAGVVSLTLSGVDVPGEIWSAVPMLLVWFLGGFAMYSTLFALAGSLVSRQEDAQSAAAPISYGMVAGYMMVFMFGYAPESTASVILSMLPPTAPFLMPMRMSAGAASPLEIAVAVVGLLLASFGAWKLAGRIYEQVLLRRGSRIAWRDAFALLRR